jgi:uncharacterized membrane protein YcaP (DUF421 family)
MLDYLFGIDWRNLFVPTVPITELFMRASVMYLGLFALLRVILKRESGAVSITDVLLVVLLSEAAQNALAAGYTSITEGFILVITIIGWNYVLNWIGYHVPRFQRLIFPQPLVLVEDGEINWDNMRRELLTEEELMTQLREQGVDDVREVQTAHMEGDGQISVIKKKEEDDDDHRPKRKRGIR